jgi:hypothetical protein
VAAADAIIARQGPVAAPLDYRVPAGAELIPLCITASFNGASASGSYVPCVEILTPDGLVLARAVLQQTIAAAEDADVSWFQGVSVCPPGSTAGLPGVGVTLETLYVDSKSSTGTTSATVLAAGVEYLLVVEGTWSFWNEALNVGSPGADAMFPSSLAGRVSTQVGVDADTLYAYPAAHPNTIGHQANFELDLGSGFQHVEPDGGPYATPLAGHLYRYTVIGQGTTIKAKVLDTILYTDNYGKLKVTIQVPSGTGTGSGAGSLVPATDTTNDGEVLAVLGGVPTLSAVDGGSP